MVARYGGDQFVAIVYGDLNLAEEKVEAAIHRIAERAPISNLAVNYGIYENVDKTLPLTLICDRAFLAMKSIQNDYEHSFAFYDEEMGRKHIRDRMMENEFDEAIRNEEFVVYLQPKYNVVTEEIAGAEALVRWKKKDGSMVSPGEFIPLYEKDGLIVRLDEYVFNKVCEIQKTLMRSGKKLIPISVNLSRASIHYENMILRYVHIVEENGIPFFAVPIELTETAALYNVQIKELTEKMVNAGFELHMDDFGSGYSSMTSLNQLPFDTLKLDKSLIDCIGDRKTALFVIISDTDDTFNFVVAIMYSQLFNLLCDKADDVYNGRLPVHVRCLLDEFANIGQIPKFDKLIATIRSREISASIILQSQSQLKTIYKDAADTIVGNCDCTLFLGGKEKSTLKELSEILGKETIDLYNTSETRSTNNSYGLNYQKTGKQLMSEDEIAVMDGGKCILQLRGVRPFLSDKYDITKHPKYKMLSDYDKRNAFDIEKYRSHKLVVKPTQTFDLYDMGEVEAD